MASLSEKDALTLAKKKYVPGGFFRVQTVTGKHIIAINRRPPTGKETASRWIVINNDQLLLCITCVALSESVFSVMFLCSSSGVCWISMIPHDQYDKALVDVGTV